MGKFIIMRAVRVNTSSAHRVHACRLCRAVRCLLPQPVQEGVTSVTACKSSRQQRAHEVFLKFALKVQCARFTGAHLQNISEIKYNINENKPFMPAGRCRMDKLNTVCH